MDRRRTLGAIVTDLGIDSGQSWIRIQEAALRRGPARRRILVSGDIRDELGLGVAENDLGDPSLDKPWLAHPMAAVIGGLSGIIAGRGTRLG